MPNLTLDSILSAESRIRPFLPPSSVKESFFLKSLYGHRVILKLENLNLSGSFKIRGALSAITALSGEEIARGILAASAGNHAQGVAYAAKMIGTPATIFMPKRAPLVKIQATKDLGAEVVLQGDSYDESYEAAIEHQKATGKTMIHGFAHQEVIAGQASIALELVKQIDDLGLIIASVGGGGLISGLVSAIKHIKPEIMVVGVQSKAYPAMESSVKSKRLVECAFGHTIADGIAVKRPSELTFNLMKDDIHDIVLVDEVDLSQAILTLMERDHLLAEGAGAAPIGALKYLSQDTIKRLGQKSIACVISGGNIDVNLLRKIIPFALRSIGRLMRLSVYIQDLPGRLADLLNVISRTGANLQDVHHNRIFGIDGFDNVEVKLDLEILDLEHKANIIKALQERGFAVKSIDS